MEWRYETNMDWFDARRSVLTATEAVSLLPSMRKKAKAGTRPAFVGLLGEKLSLVRQEQITSGAAARGHVLEPYAVEEFGRHNQGYLMYHWDNRIVIDPARSIGFSPDSLDVPMSEASPIALTANDVNAKTLLEVKSYGDKHHMQSCFTEHDKHPERYQVAYGMLVLPTIEKGYLMFYNPGNMVGYHIEEYSRDELGKELKQLDDVVNEWAATIALIKQRYAKGFPTTCRTEAQINQMEMSDLFKL